MKLKDEKIYETLEKNKNKNKNKSTLTKTNMVRPWPMLRRPFKCDDSDLLHGDRRRRGRLLCTSLF